MGGAIADLADHVRYEVLRRTGYFVTESSEHFSEYVPWFIKRDRSDLIEQYEIPLDEYITRCELQIAAWELAKAALESGELDEVRHERSHEYGSLIIHSMETGTPRVVYGNVANRGLIDNLPQGCCVEVPCLVDKNGLQPTKIGMMPPQLAALQQTNINVQSLVVEAALTGKREHIYHAAMLDPHTAAELSLEQIWSLVDDLIEAHGDMMPAVSVNAKILTRLEALLSSDPSTSKTWWQPNVGLTWQWQIGNLDIDTSIEADVYDIDLYVDQAIIDELHAKGRKVIGYMSVGSYEDWRPDKNRFATRGPWKGL